MAEIKDLDPVDADNTSIGGINAQGSAPVSNFDNIIRAVAGMLGRMADGSAPLPDTFQLGDPADLTKAIRFDAGAVTAGQTRIITLPDADVSVPSGTLVTESGTQTLSSKTLAGPVPVTGATTGSLLNVETTEASAASGPDIDLYRNSATPAADDHIGSLFFTGEDSDGNKQTYAGIRVAIVDPTSGSEDGRIQFITSGAGTAEERMWLGGGLFMNGATGADKGAGSINAVALYQNGLPLPFSNQLLHIRDVASSGSDGGSIAAGAWRTRALDATVTNEITSASLSSNKISLPAGTYFVMAWATYWMEWSENGSSNQGCVLRLRDVTNSVTLSRSLRTGMSHGSTADDLGHGGAPMTLAGRFTLSGTAEIELQHYSTIACTAGEAMGTGEEEVYTDIMIWRVG